MLNRKLVFSLFLFISTLFLISCDKLENPLDIQQNGNGNSVVSNKTGQPIPQIGEDAELGGVLSTIKFDVQAAEGLPSASVVMGFASFGNEEDAGTVSVNGNELGKSEYDGKVYYMSPSLGSFESLSNVEFDGSEHNWEVSGGGGISAFSAGVESPSDFEVLSPSADSVVNKAEGLEVSWSGQSDNEKMLFVLVGMDGNADPYVKQEVPNNGSFTIPASALSGFSGKVLLQVVKYKYSFAASGGKQFLLISEVVKSVPVTLQ